MNSWRDVLRVYGDRRLLAILLLGFSSGLPLALTGNTLSVWLAKDGVSLSSIGLFALIGLPYSLKPLWSPLLDRLPPPLPLGRRRGWAITIQLLLMVAVLAVGSLSPETDLGLMAIAALAVAFLSASQDIVIDAYRVEILEEWQQGAGAATVQTGYQLGMLASGAGAFFIAGSFGWFTAYAVMAVLLVAGMLTLLFGREPERSVSARSSPLEGRVAAFLESRPHLCGRRAQILAWLYGTFVCPFADFMSRRGWLAILLVVFGYKLGEAMAGRMAGPLYVAMGFSLEEIGAVSKVFGVIATLLGGLIGGVVVARVGVVRAMLLCGLLQSLGNLFYVLQAQSGHQIFYLALCVLAENLTGGMAGAALVGYLSSLCSTAYTATQYALLSSVASIGRTIVSSSTGKLASSFGWVNFFLMTTVVTVPALLLLLWMTARQPRPAAG